MSLFKRTCGAIAAALVLFTVVSVLGWMATPTRYKVALAQTYDLTCTAPSTPALGFVTTNPTNGHLKQEMCISSTGAIQLNDPASLSGLTFSGLTSSSLTLSGATSGTTVVQPTAVASGTITLPAATGTVALTSSLTTAQNCGTTTTCAATALTSPLRVAIGTVTLTAGIATVTALSPAFTSSTSALCTASDQTTATDGAKAVLASASSLTVTGNLTDAVTYVCVGN